MAHRMSPAAAPGREMKVTSAVNASRAPLQFPSTRVRTKYLSARAYGDAWLGQAGHLLR